MTHVIIDNDADTIRIVQTGGPAMMFPFDIRTMPKVQSFAYELINALVGEYDGHLGKTGDRGVTLMVQNDGETRIMEEW